jgi:hypothetical protein
LWLFCPASSSCSVYSDVGCDNHVVPFSSEKRFGLVYNRKDVGVNIAVCRNDQRRAPLTPPSMGRLFVVPV